LAQGGKDDLTGFVGHGAPPWVVRSLPTPGAAPLSAPRPTVQGQEGSLPLPRPLSVRSGEFAFGELQRLKGEELCARTSGGVCSCSRPPCWPPPSTRAAPTTRKKTRKSRPRPSSAKTSTAWPTRRCAT